MVKQAFLFILLTLLIGCSKDQQSFELFSIIEYALKNPTLSEFDKFTFNAEDSGNGCCLKKVISSNRLKKCIRIRINNKTATLTDGTVIPWYIDANKDGICNVEPCGMSYNVFGDFEIEPYMKEHGIKTKLIRCAIDNMESEGSFIYECNNGTRSFYLKYYHVAASGGYGVGFTVYPNKLDSEALESSKLCS